MREIISISTILFLLAVAGGETGPGDAAGACAGNLIVALVDGC